MHDDILRLAGGFSLLWLIAATTVQAQIVPDSTLPENSQITPGCTTCIINGGTTRGANLFHSFREFSIPTGGTAWFNNAPSVQAILTRVTGNSISNIDGLLRTNGTANLFFLNPNGIVFGPNARLQIAGSFLATTANQFRFPDGSEFSAVNPQAPPLLTVNLTPGLQTGTIQPGRTIANRGILSTGQDLTLVSDRLDLQGQLQSGRNLTLQGQNTVQIRDTATRPFVVAAGRNLVVQGDRSLDINALSHANSELIAGRDLILRSSNTVGGDAHYRAGGNVQIENLEGGLGNLFSPYDPVIRAQGDVRFNSYRGASLHILAGGSVIVPGLINITGVDFNQSLTEAVTLSDGRTIVNINGRERPTLDIRAGTTAIGSPLGVTGGGNFGGAPLLGANPTSANIQIGTIYTPANVEGLVLLTNQYRANPDLSGNIQVGTIDTSIIPNFSSANGGRVFIDSRGDVTLTEALNTSATFGNAGNVVVRAGGDIRTATVITTSNVNNGGNVIYTAGRNILHSGYMDTGSFWIGQGGTIAFTSTGGSITTQDDLRTDSLRGKAGEIRFTASQDINVRSLYAFSLSNRPGGDISLRAGGTLTHARGNINTGTAGTGRAGNIDMQADAIVINDSNILSGTASSGSAGNITFQSRSLAVQNGSNVTASTLSSGQGGDVLITATDLLDMRGADLSGSPSQIVSLTFGAGNAGNISVRAGTLRLRDGAIIASTTGSFESLDAPAGRGGDLTVNAAVVDIQGLSPDRTSPSRIATSTFSRNQAGALTVNTRQLVLREGGILATSTFSSGRGGDLVVNASDSVLLQGSIVGPGGRVPAAISADTFGAGRAGDLTLSTRELTIQNGGAISVSTFGSNQGGTLRVRATDAISLQGTDPEGFASGLYAQAFNSGDAGNLIVETGTLTVSDRATLTVASGNAANSKVPTAVLSAILPGFRLPRGQATGSAGTLSIQANSMRLNQGAQVLASTNSGQGGNIDISLSDLLMMRYNSLISATAGTAQAGGDGGNITINIPNGFVIGVLNENSDIRANAFTGRGGNVNITTQGIYGLQFQRQDTPFSDITASSQFGISGNVTLNVLNVDPSRSLAALPLNLVDPSRQIAQSCAARNHASGSFTVTGRGGLPLSPDESLSARPSAKQWVSLEASDRVTTTPDSRVHSSAGSTTSSSPTDVEGWTIAPDGTVQLVATTATPYSNVRSSVSCP